MGILDGNPKDEPLHYGEIYEIWVFSLKAKGCISAYRAYQYHVGDKELRKTIGEIIDQSELEVTECDEILTHNGIVPTPKLPERPEVKLEEIPVGVRFTDQEIAAMVAADISLGLVSCSAIMGNSIREDVGALFAKYHATKAAQGFKVLKMIKQKGWLIPPPLQVKRPDKEA
ncbi:hypothetical protein J2T13_001928 [Paenibacillus sp. DS2015]|uniref:DUF3231 family protein n=1 Tax=Paenibacillus sp. DS2015 TaxID=3373917 RepID=UPI003D262A2D